MPPVFSQRSQHTIAIIYLMATAVLWSFGGVLIKWISWNPLAIAGTRSLIALPLLLILFRKRRFDWSPAQIGAAFAYTATVMLFVSATKLTTAANAILLQYTAPFFVAIFSNVFIGERIRWYDWVAISIACGGMTLFFLDKLTAGNYWGNIIAVLSGIAFALMILLLRRQKDGDPLASVILGNALTGLICFPFMLKSHPNASGWTGLVLLGLFQIGLSYILYTEAIKHVTALEGVLIPVIEPVLNPLWVAFFLSEKPGQFAIMGGIIVIGSVTVRSIMSVFKEPRIRIIN